MRFKQFLQEAKYKQELSRDKLHDMLAKHCADAYDNATKPMWRGTRGLNSEAYIIQGDAGERGSANSSNHYTVILDHILPQLNFPKRGKSIICANNKGKYHAQGYGELYAIFPYDNVPIGVCQGQDLWDTKVTLGGITKKIDIWNDWFEENGIVDTSFEALANSIEESLGDRDDYAHEEVDRIFGDVKSVTQELKIGYGPKSLGMNLTTSADILDRFNDRDHECWIGGPCIAIRKDIWEEMTEEAREDNE